MDISIERKPLLTIAELTEKASAEVKELTSKPPKVFFKQVTPENIHEVAAAVSLNLDEEYREPEPCIRFGDCRFATFGNFSLLIGKAKSRKTFLVSLLLSHCLKSESQPITVNLPENKKGIIYIDTEQAKYDVAKVAKRITKGSHPDFHVKVLRSIKTKDRIKLIEYFIENTPNVGIVVIDGIRDLVNDINSAEEATEISSLLLRLTEEREIHIVTVLHQNKNDNNARGHLGTEVINKAETVVSVEKDGDISIVSPEYCRGKDFEQFAFGVGDDGAAYLLDSWSGKEANKSNAVKRSPFDFEKDAHLNILKSVYQQGDAHTYEDLITQLSLALQKNSINVGRNKVIEFQKLYSNNGWIAPSKQPGERYPKWRLTGSLTPPNI